MNITVVVIICFLLFMLGVTSTAAAFCMRERNSAKAQYNRLYEQWHNQIEDIQNLSDNLAYAESQCDYLKQRYDDLVNPEKPQTSIAVPSPAKGDVA